MTIQKEPPEHVTADAALDGLDDEYAKREGKTNGETPPDSTAQTRPDPLDVIGAPELVGWPELTADCLPPSLFRYVTAEAERLNVDPCPLAGHVLAACAVSISDAWCVKPKKHDHWTQQARSLDLRHQRCRRTWALRSFARHFGLCAREIPRPSKAGKLYS